ncbi:MAG: tetratricopeptide repeat protein [Desulfobacterales bacterium]
MAPRKPWHHMAIIALIVVLTVMPYGQVREHAFVDLDDYNYLVENPKVKYGFSVEGIIWALGFRDQDRSYWRPLTWMTHMLDFELFGENAGMHHLTNLLLHILNALLVYGVLYRMTRRIWPAALVALIFAVHPINVESVAWVTERNNLLSTFLGLITLLLYAGYCRRQSPAGYYSTLLAYLMCLMAKPILVTLPFLLLLLDYWPLNRFAPERSSGLHSRPPEASLPDLRSGEDIYLAVKKCLIEKVPFLALALGAILFSVLRFGETISAHVVPMPLRIGNAIISYVKYLGLLVWPADLAAFYPFPTELSIGHLVASIGFLCVLTVYAVLQWNRSPYLIIGWLWFLGTLVPKIGLVQAGLWPELADRWAYFPAIGVFIAGVWWGADWFPRLSKALRLGLRLTIATAIGVLTAVTWVQVGYWANSTVLFERMIDKTENNYMAHNNLGFVLIKEDRLDDAQRHFEQAIAIFPKFEIPYLNIGTIYKERGQLDAAIEWYQQALEINPRFARAYLNIGNIYFQREAFPEAIRYFSAGIQVDPNSALLYNSLGAAFTKIGRLDQAIACFEQALENDPGLKMAARNLAAVKAAHDRSRSGKAPSTQDTTPGQVQ